MTKVLQFIVCLLHPLAVVLIWLRLPARSDLSGAGQLVGGNDAWPSTVAPRTCAASRPAQVLSRISSRSNSGQSKRQTTSVSPARR